MNNALAIAAARRVTATIAALLLSLSAAAAENMNGELTTQEVAAWDPTKPRGLVRELDFVTQEGTWMSADISADGHRIAFDAPESVVRATRDVLLMVPDNEQDD